MSIKISQSSVTLDMPTENPKNKVKQNVKKDSLKRRLSGIFLSNNDPKPLPIETKKLEKSSDDSVSSQVIQKPTRRFFGFPTSLKKTKTLTAPTPVTTKKVIPEAPVVTKEVEESLAVKMPVARIQHDTPGPQHAYKISLQKLQQSSRRPLIQVLLIHQTITKATLKLRSEGIHPAQLMRERRHPDSKSFNRGIPIVRRRSCPTTQRFSSPPPYSSVENKVQDRDDDVPLGLLRKEFLKPTSASILVA